MVFYTNINKKAGLSGFYFYDSQLLQVTRLATSSFDTL